MTSLKEKIIGVKYLGNEYDILYFYDKGLNIKKDDIVLVENSKDNINDLVKVVQTEEDIKDDKVYQNLKIKQIIKRASKEEFKQYKHLLTLIPEYVNRADKIIKLHNISMDIIGAAPSFDKKKTSIYYKSNTRVDFTKALNDLSKEFKSRIELRQIYIKKKEEKYDIGRCGRECCCANKNFKIPIIKYKMLANQGFEKNPDTVAGICGKHMCCIAYEDEHYKNTRKILPKKKEIVYFEDKEAVVIDVNYLLEKIKIKIQNKEDDTFEIKECSLDQIIRACKCGKKESGPCDCLTGNPCCKK